MPQKSGESYREILKDHFASRCRVMPRYSLRKFAKDLEIPMSSLAHALNGKYGFSRDRAEKIARNLDLSRIESQYFIHLVEKEHARSIERKAIAKAKVLEMQNANLELDRASFAIVSDWYHFAILELTFVPDFKSDLGWISKRLGIQKIEADRALTRLQKLGLLKKQNGRFVCAGQFIANPDGAPCKAIRNYHRQTIERSLAALESHSPENRDFSNLMIALNPAQLPELRHKIQHFRNEMAAMISQNADRTQVYTLNLQLFCIEGQQPRTNQGDADE